MAMTLGCRPTHLRATRHDGGRVSKEGAYRSDERSALAGRAAQPQPARLPRARSGSTRRYPDRRERASQHELALNEIRINATSLPCDGLPSIVRPWRIVRPSFLQLRRTQALGGHLGQAFHRILPKGFPTWR